MMSAARFSSTLAEAVAQEQVLAAADRRRRGLADVAHRVHVLRRHRLLEEEQLEGLRLLRHALAGRHVVAAVHVDGEIDALRRTSSRMNAIFRIM